MTRPAFPLDHAPPGEAGKSYARRIKTGFFERYCSGDVVLDVGYSGYDGLHLPFADGSVDTVLSSHCLEHIEREGDAIREWFRVLKTGGFLVCFVPHQALYEKCQALPSRWNGDHKRFYTPASLMVAVEEALEVNSFRLRHLKDNDIGFDYRLGPDAHSQGCYEIELVIEKIRKPDWNLA